MTILFPWKFNYAPHTKLKVIHYRIQINRVGGRIVWAMMTMKILTDETV